MMFAELLAIKQLLDLVDPDGKRLREKRMRGDLKSKIEECYAKALDELKKN